MSTHLSAPINVKPEQLWAWGHRVLVAGLSCGLLLVALVAWKAPSFAPLAPIVLIAAGGALFLLRRPSLNLYVALAGFAIIAGYSEGLKAHEAVYGLYFLATLTHWFVSKAADPRYRFMKSPEDVALLSFLLYAAISASWGLLYGAKPGTIVGEALVLVMFAFYFPVKEACTRSKRGMAIVLGIIIWFAVFVSLRNAIEYISGLHSATKLFQIATGRVALNEALLMMPALGVVVLLLYAKRWWQVLLLGVCFVLVFSGLVLTQSRGYWAAFLLGCVALFILIDRRRKARVLLLLSGGASLFIALWFIVLGDNLALIAGGVASRFSSLGTAITNDISLVNRFYETAAVWEYIKVNPILGYGMGASYHYFHIIVDATRDWPFVHNGYAGVWFKYGLFGMSLILFFWGRSIYNGIRLFRMRSAPRMLRLTGLSVAACLIAETIVANTANAFMLSDVSLMIGLCGGLASGGLAWMRREQPLKNIHFGLEGSSRAGDLPAAHMD